jgi:cytochrome c oxidase subunit 2
MTRTVKHSLLALVGFVIVGTTILSWANILKESAQTEALPDSPDQIAASSTYAWVDKEHGVATIPVSRAMDILGEKGLPWGLVPEEPTPAPVAAAAATDSEPDAAPKPAKPAAPKLDPERVQAGQAVFTKRCQGCHAEGNTKYPTMANRYGTKVDLEGGAQAIFDEAYIRESITNPGAKIAATYKVMPTLPNLTDEDVQNLAVYIHSLTK